jgi:hypothetical protein
MFYFQVVALNPLSHISGYKRIFVLTTHTTTKIAIHTYDIFHLPQVIEDGFDLVYRFYFHCRSDDRLL